MKKLLLSMMAVLGVVCGAAQGLTLEDCRRLARDNYPAIKQYGLVAATKDYDMSNAGKGWLPKVSLQAGAYGFTDIVNAESAVGKMGMTGMENYVVGGSVTVQQTVYDGGRTAASRQTIAAKSAVEATQTDVLLYNIKVRTEEVFFGLLLIDEQLKQNDLLQNDLQVSIKTVEGMMRGGIANQTDLDALQVELLRARQQHDACEASRSAYLRMLGTLIGKELDGSTAIERPSLPAGNGGDGSLRPEMRLYASQDVLLDAQRRQLNAALLPTVAFTGMGLLHTKVTDVVNTGMLLGGLSVAWNIGALYTRKNDLRKLYARRQQNDVQRQTFLFQNKLQRQETDGSVAALRKQLESDNEIVKLREGIRRMADRKVAAGTESVNELVRDINAVNMARSQRAMHEVQLLKALYTKRSLNGDM